MCSENEGTNALSTAGKFAGMTPGTSVASSFFRSILPQAIESTWAPTLMNPLATSAVLGGVVGRWVQAASADAHADEALLAGDPDTFPLQVGLPAATRLVVCV